MNTHAEQVSRPAVFVRKWLLATEFHGPSLPPSVSSSPRIHAHTDETPLETAHAEYTDTSKSSLRQPLPENFAHRIPFPLNISRNTVPVRSNSTRKLLYHFVESVTRNICTE